MVIFCFENVKKFFSTKFVQFFNYFDESRRFESTRVFNDEFGSSPLKPCKTVTLMKLYKDRVQKWLAMVAVKNKFDKKFSSFNQFMWLVSFNTPWKLQKTSGFLMFSGGIKETSGMKWVNCVRMTGPKVFKKSNISFNLFMTEVPII